MNYSNIEFKPYDSFINPNIYKDCVIFFSWGSFIVNIVWTIYLLNFNKKNKVIETILIIWNSLFTGPAFFFILLYNDILL